MRSFANCVDISLRIDLDLFILSACTASLYSCSTRSAPASLRPSRIRFRFVYVSSLEPEPEPKAKESGKSTFGSMLGLAMLMKLESEGNW